jgi:hypothetical protein
MAEKRLNHRGRHQLLHSHLDELVADWITHTKKLPSKSTVLELMEWSSKQAKRPDHKFPG